MFYFEANGFSKDALLDSEKVDTPGLSQSDCGRDVFPMEYDRIEKRIRKYQQHSSAV